jgi:hypothetical protein
MTEGNGRIETLKEATKIYQVGPSFPPWKTSRCLCCPMASRRRLMPGQRNCWSGTTWVKDQATNQTNFPACKIKTHDKL